VKAFVPVRIRLVTPILMGRKLQVILHAKGRSLAMRERPDASLGRVRIPLWRSPSCGTTCPSTLPLRTHDVLPAQDRVRKLRNEICAVCRINP